MVSSRLRFRIAHLDQPGSGLSVVLEPPVILGRRFNCDIVLASAFVSRHHAEITYDGDNLVLRDLGSTNGTLIDGVPVDSRRFLAPRHKVRIGPYAIRVMATI